MAEGNQRDIPRYKQRHKASHNEDLQQTSLEPKQSHDHLFDPKPLSVKTKQKLNEYFKQIVTNAPVDFDSQEVKDIRNAVYAMLERISTRVNDRGIFNISRIVPTGSIAERTSIWKYEYNGGIDDDFLELDFLAILKSIDILKQFEHTNIARNGCEGCIEIENPPINFERIKHYYEDKVFNSENVTNTDLINILFFDEINSCLPSCECNEQAGYEVKIGVEVIEKHRLKPVFCETCSVEMPTGVLTVRAKMSLKPKTFSRYSGCSLKLHWISKKNSLSAPDWILVEKLKTISSLPIHVALESLTLTKSAAGYEHECVFVPKRCNVCNDEFVFSTKWRKSWCLAELNAFNAEMSDKHKLCYKIVKYLIGSLKNNFVNNYHVKTVAIRHHTTCSDNTDDCIKCVLRLMFRDLLQAFESKELLSYRSNLNILSPNRPFDESKWTCKHLIDTLGSLSETDTCETIFWKLRFY